MTFHRTHPYPPTRYMGSKEALLGPLWEVIGSLPGRSVLDLFSGSGVVSHMLKGHGRPVIANDHMAMAATFARAMVANDSAVLAPQTLDALLKPAADTDSFVSETFSGLYFDAAENRLIDDVRANLRRLDDPALRAVALSALMRACLKKRPRGIFTYTGMRYDDGRRDLRLGLADHIREQAALVNRAVFPSGQPCEAHWGDAMTTTARADIVYIDPPYFSPLSDNEYVRRYHFLEGLARDWQGVEIQAHTKTRKFASYPTPFKTAAGAAAAFETLFRRHADSAIVVSYASNALPGRDALAALLGKVKRRVEVVEVEHRYSVGTQKAGQKNAVVEYLFVGT